jgi:hypothetical protein
MIDGVDMIDIPSYHSCIVSDRDISIISPADIWTMRRAIRCLLRDWLEVLLVRHRQLNAK